MSDKNLPRQLERYSSIIKKRRSRFKTMDLFLQIYSLVGASITAAALLFFVWQLSEEYLSAEGQMIAFLGILGLAMTVFSLIFSKYINVRSDRLERNGYEEFVVFISAWTEFEYVVEHTYKSQTRSNHNPEISELLTWIQEQKFLPPRDVAMARYCLQVRNKAMHGIDAQEASRLEMIAMGRELDRLKESLKEQP